MDGVVGKTYDLKNACKQYGIAEADISLLRIAAWNPEKQEVQFRGLTPCPSGQLVR